MCVSPQRRANFWHQNFKKCSEPDVFCTFWLQNARFATAACNFSTAQLQKVLGTWGVLYILSSKCAFRHSGVQFLDISTSKSARNMRCFVHFEFKMCVSPQRRANFWTSQLQKVLRTWCVLYILTSKCAFRHSGVQFLISLPSTYLRLLFDWPDTRIIEKTQHFATSLTFRADVSSFFYLSDYCIFCLLTWLLYCCAFHLLFNSPYCRQFLFKLPSIIEYNDICQL